MGYTLATINSLIEKGAEVHIVHWDEKKLTPYEFTHKNSVFLIKRSKHNYKSLILLAQEIDPIITVVSGWQDRSYLKVASSLRKKNKIVVSGFDDQWHNSNRQLLAFILGRFNYFSRFFSHAWVTGPYQFEYARNIGFKKNEIIYDLYSADITLFQSAYLRRIEKNNLYYPRRFLYVGRLEPIKGLLCLIRAWENINYDRNDWELHIIGNGSLNDTLKLIKGIFVHNFMQPHDLINEINNYGCFILPSIDEPWGVVVHEFAAAGFPLIVSNKVGSAPIFLLSGINGFYFNSNDYLSLSNMMLKIIKFTNDDLRKMGKVSNSLSFRITPSTSADNLLSLLS